MILKSSLDNRLGITNAISTVRKLPMLPIDHPSKWQRLEVLLFRNM